MPAVLKQIRISNFRNIKQANLDLDGLTVLIGDNGSGKTSVLHAILLLKSLLQRMGRRIFNVQAGVDWPERLGFCASDPEIGTVVDADWVASTGQWNGSVTTSTGRTQFSEVDRWWTWPATKWVFENTFIEAVSKLAGLQTELVGARESGIENWRRFLTHMRLGIDHELSQVWWQDEGASLFSKPLDYILSEGQRCYMRLIAKAVLAEQRSLLIVDDVADHLDRGTIPHLVRALEEAAQVSPIVVTTHSERFLNCLSDPAKSVILCRDGGLVPADRGAVDSWLSLTHEDGSMPYSGLGDVLANGYTSHIFLRKK